MSLNTPRAAGLLLLALCTGLSGCSDSSNNNDDVVSSGASCPVALAQAVQVCIAALNTAQRACYENADRACIDNRDVAVLEAHDTLQRTVEESCEDGEFLGLSVDDTLGRLQNACQAQSDSIAWRTFGGPQGAVWPAATDDERNCLQTAHQTVSRFFDEALIAANDCLADEQCDTVSVVGEQQGAVAAAAADIAQACPALDDLIAVDARTYVERAQTQIDCTLATIHEDASPLDPRCGPSNAEAEPVRGEWTQIILDGDKWGTLCSDGSEYAIQLRLAPQGYPVDRVIVALEGGGVCLFEDDCRSRLASSPHLFSALDNEAPAGAGGIVSDDLDNPFANWTRVYLPYCNQDVFIGGGVDEVFSEDFALPRYGTVNLRAGVQVARDIIWKAMDEAGGAGFRPDELIALFGGFSAGGYGTIYNYHFMLDDLQWPRTSAFPDAGGAYDNGSIAGVRGLGDIKIPAWGAKPFLPPYCFVGDCAVGTDIYNAISPRLLQVPEQQMLILSNQKDTTQQRDAFFSVESEFVNAMRTAYCDTKDLPGIQWYLTGDSVNSVHVVSIRDEFYYGDVAGERMADWFWRAVTDPASLSDWAEEGNFVTDIPGTQPFPCNLP